MSLPFKSHFWNGLVGDGRKPKPRSELPARRIINFCPDHRAYRATDEQRPSRRKNTSKAREPDMATPLRLISVHVEEPKTGAFVWHLAEQAATGGWAEIDRADEPSNSYREAMAAGLLQLQHLMDDVDLGPRQRKERSTAPSPKPSSGPFGFGSL